MDRRSFLKSLAAVSAFGLSACQNNAVQEQPSEEDTNTETPDEPEETPELVDSLGDVSVAALKGPTAMGLVKLMSECEAGNIEDMNCSFEILASPDELTPKIAQQSVDFAALPANLASVLYNKTEGSIRVVAVNTLGVLYICEKGESVSTIADLAGKTLYASGKGATPEYALRTLLEANGMNPDSDLSIEWKSEHSECVAALSADEGSVALLPQPFVTSATMQDETIRIALDLNKEWEASVDGSALITGVMVARAALLDEHADAVQNRFLAEYKNSVDFVNNNLEEAAALVGEYDIIPEPVALKALPNCNIVCITGDEMKNKLSGYLETLFAQNPEAVGGKLPEDDFYFVG